MYAHSIQRRFVTLIEMMIVMFLIALITGVIAYNYRGSLDEGKAFKTKAGIEKVKTILELEIAKNPELSRSISSEWPQIITNSPLVHDPKALLSDGWGMPYQVRVDDQTGAVVVTSARFEEYKAKNQSLFND